jgi:hypothetical protein
MVKTTSGKINLIKFIFSHIFPWPFIITGLLLLFFGVKGIIAAIESKTWPHSDGTVITASIRRYISSSARGRTQHLAEIHYEFFVNNNGYDGYHRHTSPDAGEAAGLIERFPKGERITVYYRPDNPAKNLLEPGLRAKNWIMPLGGLLFIVPGVLMAVFLPRLMKKAD